MGMGWAALGTDEGLPAQNVGVYISISRAFDYHAVSYYPGHDNGGGGGGYVNPVVPENRWAGRNSSGSPDFWDKSVFCFLRPVQMPYSDPPRQDLRSSANAP